MLRSRLRSTALFAIVLAAACAAPDDEGSSAATDTAAADSAAGAPTSIADVGLQTPESVLYDEAADIYLVSNVNGGPAERDDNGFISRIRPTGAVDQLKWIDGAADDVTLNAPKGMAVHGDTLFVADVDTVRAFHRTTGAPLGARAVSGATFLNDLAVGADGVLYVTDTGVDGSFAPTGADAIHRFTAAGAEAVVRAPAVTAPNGIVAADDGITVVGFGDSLVQRVPVDGGAPTEVATLPAGQLDGVVRLSDGTLLVSSWEGQAVYRIAPDGAVSTAVENVEAPADIGWDSRRRRVLIPQFNDNRIEIREVR